MSKHFSLPGIKALFYLDAKTLPNNIAHMHAARIPIVISLDKTDIPFYGTPTCETETTYENKGRKQTATLSFQSLIVIPEAYPIAFIVTDANGISYLIGQREEPMPLITCVQKFGSPEDESNVLSVEVVYTQTVALVRIKLSE